MGSRSRGIRLERPKWFAFRTPLLPYDEYLRMGEGLAAGRDASGAGFPEAVARDTDLVRERLGELFARPEVRDALFVASPEAWKSLPHWYENPDGSRGQKVERTLVRYAWRMATRSTPFGLFSGVSVGRVGRHTQLELSPRSAYTRQTRLDNDYLFALCEELARDVSIREHLPLYPNSSLYEAAGSLRFARSRVAGKTRSYYLVAVEPGDYVRAMLGRAQNGATRSELARALTGDDPDIELSQALSFVDQLTDAQVLTHALTPPVTGPPPIDGILQALEGAGEAAGEARATLAGVRAALEAVDAEGLGTQPSRYEAIADELQNLPARLDLSQLFQVDMVKPAPEAELGRTVVAEIERGVDLLRQLTPRPTQDSLATFRERFEERFGDREVPLALALDEESGVGFEASAAPIAEAMPLLKHVAFPPSAPGDEGTLGRRHAHLLARAQEATALGEREIELADADIDELGADEPVELPDAFGCMPVVAAESAAEASRGNFSLFMSGVGGPSGARLLGRFCHASAAIHEYVADHLRAEEALEPAAVFAEIAHLPQGRVGNILCRPVLRDYEIPFLGLSGAPRDRQIPLDDLMVRVDGDAVVLRSRSLDRIVIPRLTAAHNFTRKTQGVYRFLCALQSQGRGAARFSWGPLEHAAFLPRVRRGRLVLSRARWKLHKYHLAPLAEAMKGLKKATTREELAELRARALDAAARLRERLGLPRHVVLSDADNELPVDFENALSVDNFIQLVRSRDSAVLYEEYPPPEELCASGPEGAFRHELALSFVQNRAPTERRPAPRPPPGRAERRFLPGSRWLLCKLYGGTGSADDILREAVAPIVREGRENQWFRRWFFLRYSGADAHVRVGFDGDPDTLAARVVPALREAADDLARDDLVWRFATDTYEREVARYGGPEAIELAEDIAWADSEAVLEIVELLEGDEGAEARWRVALRGIDLLLRDLGLDREGRRRVIAPMRERLGREHGVDTRFQKQLGVLYRSEKSALPALIESDPERDADHSYAPGFEVLAERSPRVRETAEALRARARSGHLYHDLETLAQGYVHMHATRILRAPSGPQELVLYDLLRRYYDALRAGGGIRRDEWRES